MPSRYSSYDDYADNNSYTLGRRQSRTKVLDVPDDRIAYIRQRELAAFYGEPEKSLVLRREESTENIANDDVANSRQLVRSQRSADDYARSNARGSDADYRRSSRRDSAATNYDRSGGRRRGRAQSEGGQYQQAQQDQQLQRAQTQGQNEGQQPGNGKALNECDKRARRQKISMNKDKIESGQLYYSLRDRKDGNFLERHFDSSWDGIIAAGAGAALGAVTARHLRPIYLTDEEREAHQKQNRMKMVGAAVVGAAAFNASENWFRVWAEQHEEGGEAVNTGIEACCEGLDNFPIA